MTTTLTMNTDADGKLTADSYEKNSRVEKSGKGTLYAYNPGAIKDSMKKALEANIFVSSKMYLDNTAQPMLLIKRLDIGPVELYHVMRLIMVVLLMMLY